MGSVKDLNVIRKPTLNEMGVGEFVFSDRYSVFDWGEMPDLINKKGEALCIMGAYFFERLEKLDIKTHYVGIVENEAVKHLDELEHPQQTMRVNIVRVLKPTFTNNAYNYETYKSEKENFLIPLEVIYRNSLPSGSSVFRRLNDGSVTIQELGLDREPVPGQLLDKPILDVSTKLESTDRYISWKEAQEISGITDEELTKLRSLIADINSLITSVTKAAGLENEDGKFEFGFNQKRELIAVDVLGTPDECRFTYEKFPVSKEIARDFYRETAWHNSISEAKRKDKINWKTIANINPPHLPERVCELLSLMYQSCCNEITKRTWFDVPSLPSIIKELQESISND